MLDLKVKCVRLTVTYILQEMVRNTQKGAMMISFCLSLLSDNVINGARSEGHACFCHSREITVILCILSSLLFYIVEFKPNISGQKTF